MASDANRKKALGQGMAKAVRKANKNALPLADPIKKVESEYIAMAGPMVKYLFTSGSTDNLQAVTDSGAVTTNAVTTGAFTSTGQIDAAGSITGNLLLSNLDVHVNHDGPDTDSFLYFYNANLIGASLMWDFSELSFVLSHQTDAPTFMGTASGSIFSSLLSYGDMQVGDNLITNNVDQVDMARIGNSTFKSVQELQNIFHSSGVVTGGTLTSGSDGTDVAAGTGLIRAIDSPIAELLYFDWAAGNVHIPSGSTMFIGVEYNSGSPQVFATSTESNINNNTNFCLGAATNDGVELHLENSAHAVGDHANFMIQRVHTVNGIQRDNETAGLILGETGTRNLTVTAGALWDRLNRISVSAINTSGADTFDAYFRQDQTFAKLSARTQWDNVSWDDGSGVLAELTSNRYSVLWFYLELNGEIVCVYGRGNYTSQALAQAEAVPSDIPVRLNHHGILIGRIVFQKSDATAIVIETTFTTTFAVATAAGVGTLQQVTDTGNTSDNTLLVSASGSTFSSLLSYGDITVGGKLSGAGGVLLQNNSVTAGTVLSNAHMHINANGPEGDGFLYFYENTSSTGAFLAWNDGGDSFNLSHGITVPASGSTFSTLTSYGDMTVGGTLSANNFRSLTNFYVNYDGPEGTSSLYFFENGSTTGASLAWSDSVDSFQLSHGIRVTGTTRVLTTDEGFTTANWGKAFEVESGDAFMWKQTGGSKSWGIGGSGNEFYLIQSTADDTSAAPVYPFIINEDATFNVAISGSTFSSLTSYSDTHVGGELIVEGASRYGGNIVRGGSTIAATSIVSTSIVANEDMFVNFNGPSGSTGTISFYANGSPVGATFSWIDSNDAFTFSHGLRVAGKIRNVTDPTTSQDAATKSYVDIVKAVEKLGGTVSSGSAHTLPDSATYLVSNYPGTYMDVFVDGILQNHRNVDIAYPDAGSEDRDYIEFSTTQVKFTTELTSGQFITYIIRQ